MSTLVVVHLGHQSLGHGHIVVVPVAIREAQGGYIRLLHKVFKLVELVHGVNCYKDSTDPGTAEKECKPVRHIGGPHAHMVASLYPYCQKPLGQKVHAVVELGIGKAQIPVGVDQKLVLRVFFCLVSEHFAQSHIKHKQLLRTVCRPQPESWQARNLQSADDVLRWSRSRCCPLL